MKRFLILVAVTVLAVFSVAAVRAGEKGDTAITLLPPKMEGGKPLMQCLHERQTSRGFSDAELPPQVLSDLLWAAFGINRPESGKRTAPSARNWQEIDVYVSTAGGLYVYNAKKHALDLVFAEDIRAATGRQDFVKKAPVNLIYVADFSRMGDAPDDVKDFYSAADTGFISQNVYLYCTSEGLATVVRGLVDREGLSKRMKLGTHQKVVFAQTVGYPGKE